MLGAESVARWVGYEHGESNLRVVLESVGHEHSSECEECADFVALVGGGVPAGPVADPELLWYVVEGLDAVHDGVPVSLCCECVQLAVAEADGDVVR